MKTIINQFGWAATIGIGLVFFILGFTLLKMLYTTWPMIYWFFFCPWR